MKLRQILDILFWIALTIVVILVLWRIFGNSPTNLSIIVASLLTLLLKIWSISDNLNDLKYKTSLSFHKAREEISMMNNKFESRFNNLESKLNKRSKQ